MIKNILKNGLYILILVMSLFICAEAENLPDFYTYGDEQIEETKIKMQSVNGENIIFLPSNGKREEIKIFAEFPDSADVYIKKGSKTVKFKSGMEINFGEFCSEGDACLYFSDKNGIFTDFCIKILFSENIPVMYLVSDDPAQKGREWVEERADKSNKATGFMVMQKENGETVYSGKLTEIKGRGNSTWCYVKRPYQIKLPEKTDLLETGNSKNESKTWVLLANYLDFSLLNNSIVLEMGKNLGMKTNIENNYIDLYYDGIYRGNYLLSEKVEVGSGRVDIVDLDEKNSEINAGKEDFPVKTAVTENGAEYTYCEGMISPDDITGGYLIEMDFEVRAKEEISYFKTTRGQYVVVKSPELASKEEMNYIATFYQEYEDAVYNGGVNPTTGKLYSDYVDRESLAKYYLLNEFSKAKDFLTSSAYLYKNSGEDKMYMGPLWDYDLSFTESKCELGIDEVPYGLSLYTTDFGKTLAEIADFKVLLADLYLQELLPLVEEGISDGFKEKYEKIKTSSKLNSIMWYNGENTDENTEKVFSFIEIRKNYLEVFFLTQKSGENEKFIFSDVMPDEWFYEYICKIVDSGYMKGLSDRYFYPYENVKKSETAQVIFNMSGEESPEFNEVFFDVKKEHWFSPAVIWCNNKGIMTADEDGNFQPSRYITREELICALYLYKNSPKAEESIPEKFVDRESISPYAKDAFSWAVSNGIIVGDSNNYLNPHNNITRAEFATILIRMK